MTRAGALLAIALAAPTAMSCARATPEPPPRLPALSATHNCPLADPVMEDLAAPTRSSLEDPFRFARLKAYDEWTDYDRGVAARLLDLRFPGLTERAVLAALFPAAHPPADKAFTRWVQTRAFSPGVITFLLRNYTTLEVADINGLLRQELARGRGGPRTATWLTVAASFDPTPDLTRYVLDLHLAHRIDLGETGSCKYGAWCHERLNRDLTPAEQADVLRAFADRERQLLPIFDDPSAIFATDPHGFATEARRLDGRGALAAQLLMRAGDAEAIHAFLADSGVPDWWRSLWALGLALDPPQGAADLITALRTDPTLPADVRAALSAPGTVSKPFASCRERVALLTAED